MLKTTIPTNGAAPITSLQRLIANNNIPDFPNHPQIKNHPDSFQDGSLYYFLISYSLFLIFYSSHLLNSEMRKSFISFSHPVCIFFLFKCSSFTFAGSYDLAG